MDLPTCPSCGQSVLDDDAAECPFCGSSMSAPRTATAPTSRKSKTAPSQAKSKPEPAGETAVTPEEQSTASAEKPREAMPAEQLARRRKPGQEAEVAVDEIISADQEALKRAHPVRKNPAKGYNYKIVCPMCEAPGYVPPQAAGQEAKCHNPHCMVPIFRIPEIKKKQKEPEPTSNGPALAVYGGIAAAVLLLGVGGYFLLFRSSGPSEADKPIDFVPRDPGSDLTSTPSPAPDNGVPEQQQVDQGPTLTEIREECLRQMKRAAQRVPRNQMALARRWCAEVAINLGKIEEAESQLENLTSVGETVPYHKIPPLVELAWLDRQNGDLESAKSRMQQAITCAESLRPKGRFRFEAVMSLSALMAAMGSMDAAEDLVRKQGKVSAESQLAADLFIAQHATKFDFLAAQSSSPVGGWQAPLVSGVTASLMARDQAETALAWALKSTDEATLTEALLVWSEFSITRATIEALPKQLDSVRNAIAGLSPAGKTMVLSRAGTLAAERGLSEQAQQLVAAAQEQLAAIDEPRPVSLENKKSIIRYSFPDPDTKLIYARAFAELARAQIAIGQAQAGLATMERGLAFCRSVAPSLSQTEAWLNEIDSTRWAVMRDRLKQELNLPNNEAVRREYHTYVRHCERLEILAEQRQELQVDVIAAAISPETVSEIANRIQSGGGSNGGGSLMATKLPWLVIGQLESLNEDELAYQIKSKVPQTSWPKEMYVYQARRLINEDRVSEAARVLNKMKGSDTARDAAAFALTASVIRDKQWKPALRICGALDDSSLGEEAYFMASAQASQRGDAQGVFEYCERTKPKYMEIITIDAGIVLGSSLIRKANPPDAGPSAETQASVNSEN